MKTIILPGYSLRNKDWALEIKKELKDYDVVVHEWQHWTNGSMSLPRELVRIFKTIGKEKVNIIAKSVGTRVSMSIIAKAGNQINKLILCGIPTRGLSESAKNNYSPLSEFPDNRVIIFQNINDPFAGYVDIKKFIASIKKKIQVVSKDRSDHNYHYFEDFEDFLSG
ncbi:hypothetical protein ACFL2C_03510 [Patescibacteria group bacterium]